MRETAALAGLFVEFRRLPERQLAEHQAALAPARSSPGKTIFYGKRLPPARGKRPPRCAWLLTEQGWITVEGERSVPPALRQLPPCILAASADENSCGVYWEEDGDESSVELIAGLLNSWVEASSD